MPKRSPVWNFYKVDENTRKATCKVCNIPVKFYKNNLTSLKSHLQKEHEAVYNALWPRTETRGSPQCDPSIPSTSTGITSNTMQNRLPYECAVDDEGQRANKRQELIDLHSDKNISNEGENNNNLSSARRPIDDHSIPSTSTGITSTTLKKRGPNACAGDDEDARSNKRQKLMDSNSNEKISNERENKINLDLLEFCMGGFHPFSIVEERGFKKLCRWIPGYELPTQETLSNSIMTEQYSKLHEKVYRQLTTEVKSICLTAEMWTSLKTESYLALIGHYLNEELDQKTLLLGCCQLPDTSSTNIAEAIGKLVDKYHLRSKVNFIITDNASNIVRAVKDEFRWDHFCCYADSLNSIVKNALQHVEPQIDKVRKIVDHVNNSTSSSERLRKYQIQHGQDPKHLIQAVDTRWNSTFFMLKRFIELKDAVGSMLSRSVANPNELVMKKEDWQLCNELCQILSRFEELTRSMSEEKYATGSTIIPVTTWLKDVCRTFSADKNISSRSRKTAQLLGSGLRERFKHIEKKDYMFALNTFLDPRFKNQKDLFSDPNEALETKERIRKMVAEIIEKQMATSGVSANFNIDEDTRSPLKKYDRMVSTSICQGTPMSMAQDEVKNFLSDKMLPRKDASGNPTCPQKWWKERQYVYPNLKIIYETKCNIVATSVPCDRMFSNSELELIMNARRTRLTSSKVEQIMFLNVNSPEGQFEEN
ncbi:zinc finger BED domain-containing protein 6-like [Coccinella septempunctata]|uniref:zinc finger BED domain-containing protein 6-like n=1 Tax=Coccinella septempunctata TaxID=41139 RepID=UPI001D070847|nr:zinc finger BED domain-containing protein 6-like [Coccinella septempunctata]